MKTKRINISLLMVGAAALFCACDDYLDKLPDNRAEVDTENKVTSLLASAYPTHSSSFILEFSSDNVMDNGAVYGNAVNQQEAYRWEDVSTENNDDPRSLWDAYYYAIASANEALQDIGNLGTPSSLNGQKAEALLCRAYGMFQLANVFCMPYNPTTAANDAGLPYPLKPETTVTVQYERGTMQELYDKINADIEEALPLLDDNHYTIPKYHFNTKAAYAFAARFNLYYMKYDKVIEYANHVLGADPSGVLRDNTQFISLGYTDYGNAFVKSSDPANLLLMTAYSLAGRTLCGTTYPRYKNNREMASNETFWSKGPWGSGSTNNVLYYSHKLYGSNQCIYVPKQIEFFEYKDKTGGTGYAHIVSAAFTTDETLMCRAEAYALKKDYTNAIKDLNYWQTSHCYATYGKAVRTDMTLESINTFMNGLAYAKDTVLTAKDRSIKKNLHPQGFTVEKGDQENVIQMILQCRRLETMFTGMRWADVKRYGIPVSHNIDGQTPLILKAGDLRYALQLPNDVITAGLAANPR